MPDRSDANLLGLDYVEEASVLGPPPAPIIDVHTHLRDREAVAIWKDVASRFGVEQVWTMTSLDQVDQVRDTLGDMVRFIAVPEYGAPDPVHALGDGFLERIVAFHERGATMVKLWCAPRAMDIGRAHGRPDLAMLSSPERQSAMATAADLGMSIMVHVADPDTWFASHYADSSLYGTKASHYEPLRAALDAYPVPWIAAHMGGWPERLDVLDELLSAHPNLHLDTSATKWQVRALSGHDRRELQAFFARWSGRILFGSDVVVRREHLASDAAELYASRYWALRTLFETTYDGGSPIADPDLELGIQGVSGPPGLRGMGLDRDALTVLYRSAAESFSTRTVHAH